MSFAVRAEALTSADAILSGDQMYRMGLDASLGEGDREADLVVAHKWFNLAAMQGHLEARVYRKELAMEMSVEQIAEAQRRAREYLSSRRTVTDL